jgi:hypothetical protein
MSILNIIGDTASLSIKNWPVLSFVYLGCFPGVIFHWTLHNFVSGQQVSYTCFQKETSWFFMQAKGLFSDPSTSFGAFHLTFLLWWHLRFWKGLKTDSSQTSVSFAGEISSNFDLKNMISNLAKDFSGKKWPKFARYWILKIPNRQSLMTVSRRQPRI